jgi:hypothetical protein
MAFFWGLTDSVAFHEVGDNLFIIKFKTKEEMQWIWEGRPWLFDINIFVLQQYDGLKQPKEINFNKEVLWVQMHDLPFGCMTKRSGWEHGSDNGCGGCHD